MTNEEKQALIAALEILKPQVSTVPALVKAVEIALTALTAKPVKLPAPIGQTETSKYGLEPRDGYGLHWGSVEALNECKKLLRQQGYEVAD